MLKNILFLVFTIVLFTDSRAQSIAQTRCDHLGKGVNLSNWLEGFWEQNWPDTANYKKQFFLDMKAAGVQSLRMPVCFEMVTDAQAPYYVDTNNRVFSIIDTIIAWTTELNMNLIIDNHHQWNVTDTTWRVEQPRIAHLWSVLSQRYSYLNPNHYIFEILNEPSNINNDSLALFYPPIIDTIRQYAPNHSIVVSPTSYSNGIGFYKYSPLADTNLIYTFHSYDPYQFTHQGLTFVVPPLPTHVTFPGSGVDWMIQDMWFFALQFRDSFHVPLFLGEFGVGDSADAVSRCHWIDTIGHRIDANHLSAFYWDVVGDFKIYHQGVTDQDSMLTCFAEEMHWYGDSVTAVQNIATQIPVKILPNPANNYFMCMTEADEPANMQMFDYTGRMVFENRFSKQITVSTAQFSNGLYVIKITGDRQVGITKVIVEH